MRRTVKIHSKRCSSLSHPYRTESPMQCQLENPRQQLDVCLDCLELENRLEGVSTLEYGTRQWISVSCLLSSSSMTSMSCSRPSPVSALMATVFRRLAAISLTLSGCMHLSTLFHTVIKGSSLAFSSSSTYTSHLFKPNFELL